MAEIVFDIGTVLKLPPNLDQVLKQVQSRLAKSSIAIPLSGANQIRQLQNFSGRIRNTFFK
jgi:hypothetical protein